jgi:hypothetical protein
MSYKIAGYVIGFANIVLGLMLCTNGNYFGVVNLFMGIATVFFTTEYA